MENETYLICSDGMKEFVSNSIGNLSNDKVLVDRKYIDFLLSNSIPYFEFSSYLNDCYMVPRGNKRKKFSSSEVDLIKKDLIDMPIRKVAKKYNCSVNIVQDIKLDRY